MAKRQKKKSPTGQDGKVQLKRELGLFSAVNFILAFMIGSGIFVSSASALRYSGSVNMCLLVWVLSGVISLLGALAYAELGPLVPRSGSEYAYFMDSFGPLHRFWGRLPAFVYAWIMIVMIKPAEVTVLVFTFSDYLCQPVFDALDVCDPFEKDKAIKSVALVALGIITYINVASVKMYVRVQNIFASFKIVACLVVILGGLYQIGMGRTENLYKGFEGTSTSPKDLALAFYSGLWAYDGWSAVTIVTEEVKKPEVNILRSILIAVPLVTLLYVFMNVAYMAVLTSDEMIGAQAVAVLFGEKIMGSFAFVIPIGVALATFGCALSIQFSVTRLCYVAGQDGFMLEIFSYVNYKRMTPAPAVVIQGILAFIFVLTGETIQLIEFASFLIWFFYGVAMVSLIVLRKTMKDVHRPYKVPIIIPVFILLVSIFLSFTPIVMDPSPKYLIALGFMLIGALIYYLCIYKEKRPKTLIGSINHYTQLLFQAVPPES